MQLTKPKFDGRTKSQLQQQKIKVQSLTDQVAIATTKNQSSKFDGPSRNARETQPRVRCLVQVLVNKHTTWRPKLRSILARSSVAPRVSAPSSMSASAQVVEVVCCIFQVVATAFTTDAPREFFIQKYDQVYFNKASTVHSQLLALESAEQMLESFDINIARSEGFKHWLCDAFSFQRWRRDSQGLGKPDATFVLSAEWRLLLSLTRPTKSTVEVRDQLELLKNLAPALNAVSRAAIQPGLVQRCRELISSAAKATLQQQAHNMIQPYISDYQDTVLRIIGKQVRSVKKPTWTNLANSTQLTLIKLVDEACNQQAQKDDQDAAGGCFEAARISYRAASSVEQ